MDNGHGIEPVTALTWQSLVLSSGKKNPTWPQGNQLNQLCSWRGGGRCKQWMGLQKGLRA